LTVTVTVNVPDVVGVPNNAPDVELICMPPGRPVADQLYGKVPPLAATAVFAAYPTPTVAVDGSNAVLVIVRACAAAATVSEKFFEAVF
jgi:hypothetical protein